MQSRQQSVPAQIIRAPRAEQRYKYTYKYTSAGRMIAETNVCRMRGGSCSCLFGAAAGAGDAIQNACLVVTFLGVVKAE